MEWSKADLDKTRPSTRVTVTHVGMPVSSCCSKRLAAEPCKQSLPPSLPYNVGMTNGCPSQQNPTLARKPASRISLIVSQSCDPRLGKRASSVRLVRFIFHPRVCRDPVDLPGLASIVGERLFKAGRIRPDVRDDEQDHRCRWIAYH